MVKSYGYKSPIFVSNNKTIVYCPIALQKRIGLRNYTRGYLYDFKNFLKLIKQYDKYNV